MGQPRPSGTPQAATRPLSVLASTATRWVWVPGAVDADALQQSVSEMPDVRIAIGPTASGVDGFRRSHFDAITTQQLMARLRSQQQIALFTDVQLVALITADTDRAAEFVKHTLGDLESAGAELQETVRTFVDEQCNASRAAARLYTHRNTLLRRLARADELLPRPLAESSVNVAVALDVLRWRGRLAERRLDVSQRVGLVDPQRPRRRHERVRRGRHRGIGRIDPGDESAEAAPGFEHARRFQLPICARNGIDRQAHLPRQFADRRQPGARRQLAVPDPVDDLRPELVEERLGGTADRRVPNPPTRPRASVSLKRATLVMCK